MHHRRPPRGMRLKDHTVIVTGAASGIGRAIAIRFASEGAYVLLADLAEESRGGGAPTLDVIRSAGGNADFLCADVSLWDDVQALVAHVISQHNRLAASFGKSSTSSRIRAS